MRERLPYSEARIDIVPFERSDIVTTSATLSNDTSLTYDDGGWT